MEKKDFDIISRNDNFFTLPLIIMVQKMEPWKLSCKSRSKQAKRPSLPLKLTVGKKYWKPPGIFRTVLDILTIMNVTWDLDHQVFCPVFVEEASIQQKDTYTTVDG